MLTMRKIILLTLFFLFSFLSILYSQSSKDNTLTSQESIGFRVAAGLPYITGLGVASNGLPNLSYNIDRISPSPMFAADLGMSYQYEKFGKFYIQSDFLVYMSKVKLNAATKDGVKVSAINLLGISIGAYIGKKFPLKKDTKLLVAAGVYINWELDGGYDHNDYGFYEICDDYYHYHDDYCRVRSYSRDSGNAGVQEVLWGVGGILGVEFGNHQVAISATRDISRTFKDEWYNSNLYTLKLSYTYFYKFD